MVLIWQHVDSAAVVASVVADLSELYASEYMYAKVRLKVNNVIRDK